MDSDEDPPGRYLKTIHMFDAGLDSLDIESLHLEPRDSEGSLLEEYNMSTLLISCLVEQLCSFVAKDPATAQKLNEELVKQLQILNLVDSTITSDEFKNMRNYYKEALVKLVSTAHNLVTQRSSALVPKSSSHNSREDVTDYAEISCVARSRYQNEFDNLGYIGAGGFGKVFRVKNKLDSQQYAIKKLLIKSQDLLSKDIQKEVTVLASLRHPNIIKYYGAWLEPIVPELKSKVTITEHIETFQEEHYEFSLKNNIKNLPIAAKNWEASSGSSFIQFRSDSQAETPSTLGENNEFVYTSKNGNKVEGSSSSSSDSDNSQQALLPVNQIPVNQSILYIQMELCGQTLRQWMDSRQNHIHSGSLLGSLLLKTSLSFFWQLTAALEYLHRNNIIHHDIKPGNIFVAGDAGIKLGDFGLACQYEISKDIPHRAIGTYTYAAPEQLEGGLCNFKSDIYSSGIILLELVMPPFTTSAERAEVLTSLRKDSSIPQIVREKLPQWEKLIQFVTKKNPKKRPTATRLKKIVMRLISESPIEVNSTSPKKLGEICQDMLPKEIQDMDISVEEVPNVQTFIKSRSCSKQTKSTTTIERQFQTLRICGKKEVKSEELHSTTLVGTVGSSGDLQAEDTSDEVGRLRKENASLKETIFLLRQEINLLREQIRLQGVQLEL